MCLGLTWGAPPVSAQDGSLFAEVPARAEAELKAEGRAAWIVLDPGLVPMNRRDSLRVRRGRVRLCIAGGRCDSWIEAPGQAEARIPERRGALAETIARWSRFLASALPTGLRETVEFRARDGLDPHAEALPPALLFPDAGLVLGDRFRLVWLPALAAGPATEGPTRVRLSLAQGGCHPGALLLDTTAAGNRLGISDNLGPLQPGRTYHVALTSQAGEDARCFEVAGAAETRAIEASLDTLAQALGSKTGDSDLRDPVRLDVEGTLAATALLDQEGFGYDALLMMDALRQRSPGDPYLRTLWGHLLHATQAVPAQPDGAESTTNER